MYILNNSKSFFQKESKLKNIPIFLASDDKYAPYMAMTMASVLQNTNSGIDFYILDGGISEKNKDLVRQTIQVYPSYKKCEYIKMDASLVKDFPDIQHFSLNTYFRYFIADLKPKLTKALYLDCDMIICGDIAELYNVDVSEYGIAAVPYICDDDKYSKSGHYKWVTAQKSMLNMQPSSLYFNAGLLLMNLQYIRKNNLKQQFINKTTELKDIITCPDQDVLNIIFENKYKILPLKYNIVVDITSDLLDVDKYVKKFKNSCFVIHYTGGHGMRPWLGGKILAKYFWNVAKKTPYFRFLKQQSKENIRFNNPQKRIYILGIPVLFIKSKPSCTKVRLFNIIPIISIKKKNR